jgi:four helix bundle protein
MRKEFEERLIRFASDIVSLKQYIKTSYEGDHLAKQLIRSGTSVALNFGEVQGAETTKDFIHKQSIVLKELRETYINLKIIEMNGLASNPSFLSKALDENDQLIRIFTSSIQTSKRNQGKLNAR